MIAATQSLLAEHGIEGTTVDAVAKRSGVAKTTIYRHFQTGNELLVYVLACQIEPIEAPNTGTFEQDLLAMLTTMSRMLDDPALARMVLDMTSAATRDPELAAVKDAMIAERHRSLEEIVLRAMDRGDIPPVRVEEAVRFIEGPFAGRLMMNVGPMTPEELRRLARRLVEGLRADPKT